MTAQKQSIKNGIHQAATVLSGLAIELGNGHAFVFDRMTALQKIYTEEDGLGGAAILLDQFDGQTPEKIGHLPYAPLKMRDYNSETDLAHLMPYFPKAFVASFGGDYLLSVPHDGFGLGEDAIVIARDGGTHYPIDFYWFASHAVWIGDNTLLTQEYEDNAVEYTFSPGGNVSMREMPTSIGDEFAQKTLSPDRKWLAAVVSNPERIRLTKMDTYEQTEVPSIAVGSDPAQRATVLGWNRQSNKFLYSIGDEVRLFDLESQQTTTESKVLRSAGEPESISADANAESNYAAG